MIVGANLAGARAAEALRKEGFDGRLTIVGDEPHLPYERPPLSKELLLGKIEAGALPLRIDWAALDVELVTGERVVAITAADRRLTLASGAELRADKILLATGGGCAPLDVPGADLDGVCSLRTLDDAHQLAGRLVPGARVVVVGGGFIGLEVAASAQTIGCEVTVVEAATVPLSRGLGPEWGAFVAERHLERGVRIGIGVGVRAIQGRTRVTGVELDNGMVFPADVVVVGVGIRPRTELAEALGLPIAGGIVVDASGRTSNPAVFAAGDVTVQPSWRGDRLVRYESYQNAQDQAQVAASAMLDRRHSGRDVPWFWSDQFDLNIQTAGELGDVDEIVVRGDPDQLSFTAFHLRGDRIGGVFAINRGKDVRATMKLIATRVPVEVAELLDESVDLRRLARRAPTAIRQ